MKNILILDPSVTNAQKLIELLDEATSLSLRAQNELSNIDTSFEDFKANIILANASFLKSDASNMRNILQICHDKKLFILMYASHNEYLLFEKSIDFIDDVIFKPIKKEELISKIEFHSNKMDSKESADLFSLERMKMEAVGEMISMIAHQWRQPLTAMGSQIGQVEIDIAMDEMKPSGITDICNSMKAQITYLSETIDDFRFYFTPSANRSDSSLKEIVERSQNVISIALAQNRITMIVEEPLSDINLYVHLNEVVQVVINVINNAMDEMISRNTQAPFIRISSKVDAKMMHLYISDNAGGIDDKIINKIFDPYFSTKKKKNGTGLGLYMAKNIIERHCDGLLRVKNIEGGAQFELSFPIK